ncbi:MAG: DUF1453 family protein [Candidatus Eremiobacteraeota bacterium]|nr:DUF1453 family protein [Candidatus Eremiobacteraeota bacterium]
MPAWLQLLPLVIVVVLLAVRMVRPQRISVTRMWLTPIILCGLTAWVIYANEMLNPAPPIEIVLGLAIGGLLGIPFGALRGRHTDVRPTDRRGVMYLGSSWVTLVILLAVFGFRFVIRTLMPHRGSLAATVGDGLLAFVITYIAASYAVIFQKYEALTKST